MEWDLLIEQDELVESFCFRGERKVVKILIMKLLDCVRIVWMLWFMMVLKMIGWVLFDLVVLLICCIMVCVFFLVLMYGFVSLMKLMFLNCVRRFWFRVLVVILVLFEMKNVVCFICIESFKVGMIFGYDRLCVVRGFFVVVLLFIFKGQVRIQWSCFWFCLSFFNLIVERLFWQSMQFFLISLVFMMQSMWGVRMYFLVR